ncbi:hypothetical protein VE04_07442 [Pseudogymnoascus sp. 24MN13]|nr:hypothetical protein VE04_07442 [Pseudogymnoascus sp. 24MN13]
MEDYPGKSYLPIVYKYAFHERYHLYNSPNTISQTLDFDVAMTENRNPEEGRHRNVRGLMNLLQVRLNCFCGRMKCHCPSELVWTPIQLEISK